MKPGWSEEAGDTAVIKGRADVTMGSSSEDEDEVNVEGVLVNGDASTPGPPLGSMT